MGDFFGWVLGLLSVLPGVGVAPPPHFDGYVEADYLYVAAVSPGVITSIAVEEGDLVTRGAVLVELAASQQRAALDAALARVAAAEANLRNLESGSRREEVDVVRASLAKAEADLTLADQNLLRAQKLFDQGLVPVAQVDQARATAASAKAQVAQLRAQLAVAELPARSEQQIAAQATLDAARADAERARADLADRTLLAPADAKVERLYYDAGEMAMAGGALLALRPPEALKVKFYVPEVLRSSLALGQGVSVSCDGCSNALHGTLSYVAADPQFTAPIIFSRDERGRLVYLVEARLDGDAGLLPGQPVSVEFGP